MSGKTRIEITGRQARQFSRRAAQHFQKQSLERGIAFEAQPLRLVFIRVGREADQVRDLRKNPRRRMRKRNRFENAQAVALAERNRAGAPVALFIKCKHHSAIGIGRVESAGCVAKVMFEVQDFEVRRLAQRFEQAAVVEFAAELAKRLRLVIAAGNRSKWRQLRAHPCLTHPGAHGPTGHGHAFHAVPPGPRALQAKANRLARNSRGGAPAHELALLHGGENAVVGKQRRCGIVSEPGKAEDVQALPLLLPGI